MKVIDLLNKIANGEKVPEKIRYCSDLYKIDYCDMDYENQYINDTYLIRDVISSSEKLTNEIEILEEEKKIPEKVDFDISKFNYKEYELNIMRNNVIANTKAINEIIDCLKHLKGKGDE